MSRSVPAPPTPPARPVAASRTRMGPRVAAYLLDSGLAAMLTAATLGLVNPAPGKATLVVELALAVVMWALVRVVAPQITGESPGKRMLGLVTLDAAGAPISPRTLAFRELVCWLLYWIPLFAPIDAAIAERRGGRSTRDQLAKTSVAGTQAATGLKVSGVVALGLLATAAAWFTIAAWDARPARVDRAILASCADQGGNMAQCHCLLDRLGGDLDEGQMNAARHALGDRLSLAAPSGLVMHTVRLAWADCVGSGARVVDGGSALDRWRAYRSTAIEACVRTGGTTAVCACVLDRAAAAVGPSEMLNADRAEREGRTTSRAAEDAIIDAAHVCAGASGDAGGPAGADGRS